MIYSSRSIFCNSSWFVNDWKETVFIFVVVENVKVKVPGGIEKFIGLQRNGI